MGSSRGRGWVPYVRSETMHSDRGGVSTDIVANLDSVRGLACLLVVAYHVVGETSATGMHLPTGSPWQYAMLSLEFLRMPLFTALSGYLYARERVRRDGFKRFWARKLRRIGIPFLTVTYISWMLRREVYGDATPAVDAFFLGYQHLWYLQALLVLFATISICDAIARVSDEVLILAALGLVTITQSVSSLPNILGTGGALYLGPYFLFGIVLYNRSAWLVTARVATTALGIVGIVLLAQQAGMQGLAPKMTVMQLPAALCGMSFVVFLLQYVPVNGMLAGVGRYSYTIYLWQVIVSAGARMILLRCGIDNEFALFGLICSAGITGPVALHHAVARLRPVCVLLTGETGLPRRRKERASAPSDVVADPKVLVASA